MRDPGEQGEDRIVVEHNEVQVIRETAEETGESLEGTYRSWLAAKEDQEDEE